MRFVAHNLCSLQNLLSQMSQVPFWATQRKMAGRGGYGGGRGSGVNYYAQPKPLVTESSEWVFSDHEWYRNPQTGRPKMELAGHFLCKKGCGADYYHDCIGKPCVPKGAATYVTHTTDEQKEWAAKILEHEAAVLAHQNDVRKQKAEMFEVKKAMMGQGFA